MRREGRGDGKGEKKRDGKRRGGGRAAQVPQFTFFGFATAFVKLKALLLCTGVKTFASVPLAGQH